jgi:inner membrane transporter RhtA
MLWRSSGASAPLAERLPPHAYFLVSAIFHYLGPSFAVLLFAHVEPLGVAWLRIAAAALVFALWRRPWRVLLDAARQERALIVALAASLAAMNACFYLAIDLLPLATVASIEFVAVIAVALLGVRNKRNLAALAVTLLGVYALIGIAEGGSRLGLFFALLNAGLFALYIVLGHAIARAVGASGIDSLSAAMLLGLVFAAPIGFGDAVPSLFSPALLLAGIGVGITSSVIPYVCDQLAMARLPRATFALMLSLLPAVAAIMGAIVLRQIPSAVELAGIALVGLGIAIHKPAGEKATRAAPSPRSACRDGP